MRTVIPVSIALGIIWNLLAIWLLGGRVVDALTPGWLLAGALAGVAAGVFTMWSRRQRDGEESVLYGIATYYLGILVYWGSFVVIERFYVCPCFHFLSPVIEVWAGLDMDRTRRVPLAGDCKERGKPSDSSRLS